MQVYPVDLIISMRVLSDYALSVSGAVISSTILAVLVTVGRLKIFAESFLAVNSSREFSGRCIEGRTFFHVHYIWP